MKFVSLPSLLLSATSSTLFFGNTLAAKPCPISDSVEGLGEVYSFTDLGKLSVVGFTTTVNYVTSAAGKFCQNNLCTTLWLI